MNWRRARDALVASVTPRRGRVGVMVCALNESTTIGFAIDPWLDVADLIVIVDTGSTDGTPALVEHLYGDHLRRGHVILLHVPCPNFEISLARQAALDCLVAAGMTTFVKVDADFVFTDDGARRAARALRRLPPRFDALACDFTELYQHDAETDESWLAALRERAPIFSMIPTRWPIVVAQRCDADSRAYGSWTDEAAGAPPEGVSNPNSGATLTVPERWAVHYGWARPVARKRAKIRIWRQSSDRRVETLHLTESLAPFSDHPEAIGRRIDQIERWHRSSAPAEWSWPERTD